MTETPQLFVVRPGCNQPLLWPQSVGGGVRGHAGTVVRGDDPLLDREGGVSQQWKLRPAPAGAEVTPHSNARAAAFYATQGFDVPYEAPVEPAQAACAAEAPDLSLPTADEAHAGAQAAKVPKEQYEAAPEDDEEA